LGLQLTITSQEFHLVSNSLAWNCLVMILFFFFC